jgi:hypothetical protein
MPDNNKEKVKKAPKTPKKPKKEKKPKGKTSSNKSKSGSSVMRVYTEPVSRPQGRRDQIPVPYYPVSNPIPSPYMGGVIPDYISESQRQQTLGRLLNRMSDIETSMTGVKHWLKDSPDVFSSKKIPSVSGESPSMVDNPLYSPDKKNKSTQLYSEDKNYHVMTLDGKEYYLDREGNKVIQKYKLPSIKEESASSSKGKK